MQQHTGGVRRGPRQADNFTILSNAVLNDQNLSFRARGVLIWILAKPADWSIRSEAIAAQSPCEGRTAVRTAMRELEEHGYLVREKIQNELGQWATIQTVYEEPVTSEDPSPEPKTRKSSSGQPRDGQTGVFTKDGSPRTETNNNTSEQGTSPANVLGEDMLLSEAAQQELKKCAENYANLQVACADAGLTASFEHVKPAQKGDIFAMIDLHGIKALVDRAKAMHKPNNPTLYAQGWIPMWKAMPLKSTVKDETPTPPSMARVRAHDGCGDCEYGWVLGADRLPLEPPVRCACKTRTAA